MNTLSRMAALLGPVLLSSAGLAQDDSSVPSLRGKALQALADGDQRQAVENADAIIRQAPDDPRATLQAADIYLRAGQFRWAVRQFDRFLKSERQALPELWQRGIALYFIGQYEKAAEQFEVHRTVNPNDVENAAWHFLCVSKAESPSEARAKLLPAPGDPRPPMEEVMQMLKTGQQDVVIDKMESLPVDSPQRKLAEFYGNFYLGLYADAMGQAAEARKRMNKSAAAAPQSYMGDIARVYAQYLKESK